MSKRNTNSKSNKGKQPEPAVPVGLIEERVRKEVEFELLDEEDQARQVASMGQVRKQIERLRGNATALGALRACRNGLLDLPAIENELLELVVDARKALMQVRKARMAS